ncbi:BatD family protein [Hymenobacter sp. BT730]|uniref:BatD family protein n=1 Tax=Hymenobacter sp. BT730 TaxID=3063332 RepID=UPI0026DFBC13|nr:BatD family protein [Hymenobacter sp. BT730]
MISGFRWFWLSMGLLLHVSAAAQIVVPPAATPTPATPAPAAPATPTGSVAIVLGPTAFPINEYFTIAFRLTGAPLERYSAFPDIEGFKKSGKSSTTTTRITNGQTTTELTITQRYAAFKEGEFVLKPFTLTINGLTARSAGASLKVLPQQAATAPPAGGVAPGIGLLDQLFGKPKPQDFVEPRDNAFLAVAPDKTSVYVGEGVNVGLYFYLTPTDQGLLNFYNFSSQLPGILRQLRQPTVWEEPFDEQEVLPEATVVGGKPYLRYRLYAAEYYPLTPRTLQLPAVALQMVKYKVAKKPEPGLDNRMEGLKTYFSLPRTIAVKPLPSHPRRDEAVVGSYRLLESIDRTNFLTGQAFTYTLRIEGEGNLTALQAPVPAPHPGLEIYGPEVQQETTRASGRVGGRKTFRYRLIARQPGTVPLDSLFSILTFDPVAARYVTLRPELHVVVSGAPRMLRTLSARTSDPYYEQRLFNYDNTLRPLHTPDFVRRYANLLLVALFLLTVVGWWRGNAGPRS